MTSVSPAGPASALNLAPADWRAASGRVPSLDGVRAVSVLLVLSGHMLLPAQWVGVSALGLKTFFFMSGFLITRLLLAEINATGGLDLVSFYQRRVLRLYPVIVVYVSVVALVLYLRGQAIPPLEVASVFFYFVNYLVVHYDAIGTQQYVLPVSMLWSLSVEEHFYLLAPMALVLASGRAKKMFFMAFTLCVLCLCLRLLYAAQDPRIIETLELYWRSETRFDCIAFGVLLACMTESAEGRRWIGLLSSPMAFASGALLLAATFMWRDDYWQLTWRFTLQSLALIPLVCGVVFGAPYPWINRMLNSKWMVWVGTLSYSLYVWHGGVMFLFGEWLNMLPARLLPICELAVTFVLACASYYMIERPVTTLRGRLHRRKAARGRGQESAPPAI